MFDQTIRRMLSLFPRGATNDQLIWRLSASGVRVSASELLAGLGSLAERGEIVRDAYGRWQVSRLAPTPSRQNSKNSSNSSAATPDFLIAVDATCYPNAATSSVAGTIEGEVAGALPDWGPLLTYYAATQRKDPRGQIEVFADRHGSAWQLFRATGTWWSDASLRISMELLPGTFTEALSKRKLSSAAIGWPVSLFPCSEGTAFIPGLILPVDFRINGSDLTLDIEATVPALNPAWLREVCRHTSWSASELSDALFPEGEENTLGAVSDRMRHCLAALGGPTLRPAELAPEISIREKGLRNAAALFLPEDGSFTKGAAEDLEAIREWPIEKRVNTALAKLLADTADADPATDKVSVIPPGKRGALTDTQLEAAEAALRGPLTVIQGPPGSGKSQVILSLIISAVMAGKSVLFSAKNHQAVTEVEERLKEIVSDLPLLTRARDAEGERDVSFLDALTHIAHDHSREPKAVSIEVVKVNDSILQRARGQQEARRKISEQTAIHLALSELAERREVLARHLTIKKSRQGVKYWLLRLLRVLRLLRIPATDPLEPLPDDASVREIDARISELRALLTKVGSAPSHVDAPLDAEQIALGRDVAAFLPKFAAAITRPEEIERKYLSERARELEFMKIRNARRMPPEDARSVLRHRPIWAVSTLSVPARVPLVPTLFDYVIFDEASQSDIASALPLFARASKAVVVGDPMQLTFVPPLGTAAEHALMDAAGLPKMGRSAFAQSVNSLFDFCERRPVARRMLLADQFRSAPAIVDYLNADFYNGRLTDRRSDEHFRPPNGYRPGLAWEHISGNVTRRDGGTVNIAEAKHTAALLRRFAADATFNGSVGVISPFNAQVAEIQQFVHQQLTGKERDRLSLRLATVDKFQGGEADVIIFSMVLAPGAPFSTRTFLQKERRRFNVAISRARALCIIVGDLDYSKSCRIRHIEFLADRASRPWSPPKPNLFDSSWERRLDTAMRARGLEPIPQHPVGRRYLDFALISGEVKLDIEVDGRRWHTDASGNRKIADRLRDQEMRGRGWKVLRFWVHQLAEDMEACLDSIERELGRGSRPDTRS